MELDVSLDIEASPGEVEGVRAAFASLEIDDVRVEANYFRKSLEVGDLPWVVLISLGSLAAKQFVSLLVKDGYDAAKQWVRSVWEARTGTEGSIVIRDGLWLILDDHLPEEAYEQLAQLDLDASEGRQVQWDPVTMSWLIR